jgi:hypothetical protein
VEQGEKLSGVPLKLKLLNSKNSTRTNLLIIRPITVHSLDLLMLFKEILAV